MPDIRKLAALSLGLIVMSLLWMGCGSRSDSTASKSGAGYAGGDSARTITSEEVAAMPQWQEGLLADPAWNQDYAAPGEDESSGAPKYGELQSATDKEKGQLPLAVETGQGSVSQRIESWFSPAAYAADSGVDIKYLIRTGTIVTKVEDFEQSQDEVYAVAAKYGGLVTDSQITNIGDNQRQGSLTLRVPNTRFIEAFNELREIGETESENVGSQDVSHEYVSAVSQLKNLNAEQETLRQMLAEALAVQRSRGLGDAYTMLLDTQKRLSEVSGQIQSVEDRIGQLADQITRSTITVTLIQRDKVDSGEFSWGFGATLDKAKHDVVLGMRNFLNGLLYFAVAGWMWVWPWVLIGFVGWRVWKKVGRRRSEVGSQI
jgi:hypothetical protein